MVNQLFSIFVYNIFVFFYLFPENLSFKLNDISLQLRSINENLKDHNERIKKLEDAIGRLGKTTENNT